MFHSVLNIFEISAGKHVSEFIFYYNCRPQAATLLKRTPSQVFSCEFCKILKNINYVQHLLKAVSTHRYYVYKHKRPRVSKQQMNELIPYRFDNHTFSQDIFLAVMKWLCQNG